MLGMVENILGNIVTIPCFAMEDCKLLHIATPQINYQSTLRARILLLIHYPRAERLLHSWDMRVFQRFTVTSKPEFVTLPPIPQPPFKKTGGLNRRKPTIFVRPRKRSALPVFAEVWGEGQTPPCFAFRLANIPTENMCPLC